MRIPWTEPCLGVAVAAIALGLAVSPALANDANAPAPDPADQRLSEAWRHLELVNYPAAEKAFQAVLSGEADRARQAEAHFGLGHLSQYRRPGEDIAFARKKYQLVAETFADTPSAPLAWMALARLADAPEYEKQRDRDKARELYRKIVDDYADSQTAHEARLRLAMTYFEDPTDPNAQTRGISLLTHHLDKHPRNYVAIAMHTQLALVHQVRGEYAESVEHWIAADDVDEQAARAELSAEDRKLGGRRLLSRIAQHRVMDSSARATQYYRIAQLAEKRLKDYELAVKYYERIVYEIVRDNKYFVAKLAAERCRKLSAEAGKEIPPHPLAGEIDTGVAAEEGEQ